MNQDSRKFRDIWALPQR